MLRRCRCCVCRAASAEVQPAARAVAAAASVHRDWRRLPRAAAAPAARAGARGAQQHAAAGADGRAGRGAVQVRPRSRYAHARVPTLVCVLCLPGRYVYLCCPFDYMPAMLLCCILLLPCLRAHAGVSRTRRARSTSQTSPAFTAAAPSPAPASSWTAMQASSCTTSEPWRGGFAGCAGGC